MLPAPAAFLPPVRRHRRRPGRGFPLSASSCRHTAELFQSCAPALYPGKNPAVSFVRHQPEQSPETYTVPQESLQIMRPVAQMSQTEPSLVTHFLSKECGSPLRGCRIFGRLLSSQDNLLPHRSPWSKARRLGHGGSGHSSYPCRRDPAWQKSAFL